MLSLFRRRAPVAIPLPAPAPFTAPPLNISPAALEELSRGGRSRQNPFLGIPQPPPGVRPASSPAPKGMAMDEISAAPGGAWGVWAQGGLWGEGLWFPGYPYLAELAQRPEYRNITETIAEEMTRKWIKLLSTGKEDKTAKVKAIEAAMKLLGAREAFNRGAELDGFMGMGMIFLDMGVSDDPEELASELLLDDGKIGKGALKGLVAVEPTWVSPDVYNSIDPLKDDYLKPQTWWIMGKRVHTSRLLIIRSREIPDILKAAYNFGGLSLSQISKPSVDNWLRTRQSVSDLLHSFTVFVLKTNVMAYLQNASQLAARIGAFILGRDNKGLFLVDKEREDFANVSAPLGTLDALQAQSEEQMAFPSKLALVKMFGLSPKGLNATPDGEIRVMYDHIHGLQERVFGPNITKLLHIIQLSLFGAIDDEITFEFVPLWELDAAGKAAVVKTQADTDAVYMEGSVVSNEEVRARLAGNPESPYHGLEGPAPEMPDPAEGEANETDMAEKIGKEGAEGSESGANSGDAAFDAWNENDHPRASNGEFGTGGGANKSAKVKLTPKEKTYISSYTGDDFLKTNEGLREGKQPSEAVKSIDSAIDKSTLSEGTKLYRGISREGAKKLFGRPYRKNTVWFHLI